MGTAEMVEKYMIDTVKCQLIVVDLSHCLSCIHLSYVFNECMWDVKHMRLLNAFQVSE